MPHYVCLKPVHVINQASCQKDQLKKKLTYHLLTGRAICEQKLGTGIKIYKNQQTLCSAKKEITISQSYQI